MTKFKGIVLIGAASLAACQGGGSTTTTNQSTATPEKAMPKNAEEVVAIFKAAKQPVEKVKIVTEADDDNHLMGRPNQYTSKAFFFDARHMQEAEFGGGENTIEVFATPADATARREYIEGLTKGSPMLMQYFIQNGAVLVRLDKVILPSEAKQYEAALKAAM